MPLISDPLRPWHAPTFSQETLTELARALDLSPLAAQVLLARGYGELEPARRFLEAALSELPDPGLLADVERAVARLIKALKDGEKITVYGDYDVDGVTSTALLWLFFRDTFGISLDCYIPNRLTEGYGLNTAAIERIAGRGTQVLVTVDNGSSAVKETALARSLGMDVIVIDHHQVSDPEPEVFAHLNPHRKTCGFPDKGLAAVGVAFLLIVQLRRRLKEAGAFQSRPLPRPDLYLDLVALGTVADVAPLAGVNRAMVRYGLDLMRARPRVGVSALLEVSRLTPDVLTARDLGFRLGPRINAAGRLDDATHGLELLVGEDTFRAAVLAQEVENLNRERQGIERGIVLEAEAQVLERFAETSALVVAGEGWHIGVVGIVAARLVERFQRPAIVLAPDGPELKGSARSVPGVDIKRALDRCQSFLIRHGGHAAAAGLALREEHLEAFREAFCEAVSAVVGEGIGVPPRLVDGEVPLWALSRASVASLERLAPFGHANPAPCFLARGVKLNPSVLKGGHLKATVSGQDGPVDVLAWRMEAKRALFDRPVDLLFSPRLETYRGVTRVSVMVEDARPSELP